MKLKRTETNVSTILQSLKDEKEEERSKAALRLGQLIDDVNEVEITGIIDALNEARNIEESNTLKSRIETVLNIYTKAEKETKCRKEEEAARRKEEEKRRKEEEAARKEEADSEDLWQCGSCGKEFDSYEVARFHEDNECVVARGKEEEIARRKEEAAAREKSEQQIAEEGDELDSFTYKSRESSKRFPTNTTLIGVYRFLAYLAVGAGIVIGLLLLGDGGGVAALGIILAGVAIGINMLLVSEMIKFLMDFHDANYINTKVRIKTLEALQEISKKLRK